MVARLILAFMRLRKQHLLGYRKMRPTLGSAKAFACNCINLGWANTEGEHALQTGFHKQPENWAEIAGAKVPFGRLILPEHIAGTCAYLVSPAAELMTGAVIDYEQMPVGTYDFHPMVSRD